MTEWFEEHMEALSMLAGIAAMPWLVLIGVVVLGTVHLGLAYLYYGGKYKWRNRGATAYKPKGLSEFDKIQLQMKERSKVFLQSSNVFGKLMDQAREASTARKFARSKVLGEEAEEIIRLQKLVTAELHKFGEASDRELPAVADEMMNKVAVLRTHSEKCTGILAEAA